MSSKMVPLSVRIAQEDAAYIAGLHVDGARTPSEKIRALIAEARQREYEAHEFAAVLRFVQAMLSPSVNKIRELERAHRMHSELISRLSEWLPATIAAIATVQAEQSSDAEMLLGFEAELAGRVMLLMESMLQLGVTANAPCYTSGLISQRIAPIAELVKMVESKTFKEGESDE